jgi:lysophospholipase L1-like esterase
MKNIICYGDSNTWGNIAGSINLEFRLAQRYEYGQRWPTIMQNLLGPTFQIIEAGLNGRTTAFDEKSIVRPSRNGLATLPGILEMHYPLDLVIFMLGTNDVKIEYDASLEQITVNMQQLIQTVKTSHFGPNYQAPRVMMICPSPIHQVDNPAFSAYYDELSIIKSQQLSQYYAKLASHEQCALLDAGPIVKVSDTDGVHLEQASHADLATHIAQIILAMEL